jgi:elongation factor Ts
MSKPTFIEQVKAFRAKTNAPLGRCSQVLKAAGGDEEKALKLLREEELKSAGKKGERETKEGLLKGFVSKDGKKVAVVEMLCETDSVAKNKFFLEFVERVGQALLMASDLTMNHDAFMGMSLDSENTVESARVALVGVMGENIRLGRFRLLETTGFWSVYCHGTRIAVPLALAHEDEELGRSVAMHVAAMSPEAIDENDLAADVREASIARFRQEALESGKPEAIVDKIAQGKFNKWVGEVTLYGQTFIKELVKPAGEQRTVGQCVAAQKNQVLSFERVVLHGMD